VYGDKFTFTNYFLKTVFWDVTQRNLVISYKHCGRMYPFHGWGTRGFTLSYYWHYVPNDLMSSLIVVRSWSITIFQIFVTSVY